MDIISVSAIVFILLLLLVIIILLGTYYYFNSYREPLAGRLLDFVEDIIDDYFDEILAEVNLATASITAAATTTFNACLKITDDSIAVITKEYNDTIAFIENLANTTYSNLTKSLTDVFNSIFSMFEGYWNEFLKTLMHMITLVSKGIIDAGTAITEGMKDLGDLGQKWAKDAIDWLDKVFKF